MRKSRAHLNKKHCSLVKIWSFSLGNVCTTSSAENFRGKCGLITVFSIATDMFGASNSINRKTINIHVQIDRGRKNYYIVAFIANHAASQLFYKLAYER